MEHASLFSGIGGFDLAAKWAGWNNVFNCEIDPFCRKVLQYHFPKAKQYEDIKTTNFEFYRGKIDILTGGFPCQPFSLAGKRKGTSDDRYLWPEMLQAIKQIQPRWVVAENVYGLLSIKNGLVFEQVCVDLENEGYEVQPFVIPACGVNAPHRRYRVWIIAHSSNARTKSECRRETKICKSESSANGKSTRQPRKFSEEQESWKFDGQNLRDFSTVFCNFQTQSPICSRNDGIPNKLDGITFPKWREQSIKAYGNAIVPQVAVKIFECIIKYKQTN